MEYRKLKSLAGKNNFAQMIGLEILEVEEGYARGRVRMDERLTNIYEGMHGGCIYTMADTVTGIAASTYGNYVTTIDGKINYLLPVKDTMYVYCLAKVKRQGGRIGVYEAEITNDRNEVLATADFTYYRTSEKIPDSI